MLTAIDPTTGKMVREVSPVDEGGLNEIIEKAYHAFDGWRKTPFSERARVLKAAAEYMRENADQLGYLMTEEMGKPVGEALGEVNKAAWCAEHYAEHGEAYLSEDVLASDATRSYVQYLPLGTILGILPWNAPFWLAFRFCAPALMAGNTCVLKHDPHVPGCAAAIAEVFEKIGAPKDIMVNLPAETPLVEKAIRHPHIQAVSFTGSDKAGAAVASIAASEIKHSVLELGGSDPAIVLADADLDKAADAITLSRIINAGQSCIASKRIIVEAPVYDEMVQKMTERLSKLKVGDPRDKENQIGPIARPDLRENLHRQVQKTIEAGARCVMGGEMTKGDGYFYPVTLLADVTNDMVACSEETFGPVAVLMKVEDVEEALSVANDTPYGLAASIWTDTQRGVKLAPEIEAGQVVVNGIVKTDPRLPSGGIKRSGFGRELGPHGIHEFVNAQQVWVGPVKPA